MYHKHSTEGFILRGFEKGDSSKTIALFSKEFGFIYASVQNARSGISKLRYSVQDFTHGNFSLVRGRYTWKVVGAETAENVFWNTESKEKRTLLGRIFLLISRLGGEERNEALYEIVENLIQDLKSEESKETLLENLQHQEARAALQILSNLGFVEETAEEIELLSLDWKKATAVINESLKAAGIL